MDLKSVTSFPVQQLELQDRTFMPASIKHFCTYSTTRDVELNVIKTKTQLTGEKGNALNVTVRKHKTHPEPWTVVAGKSLLQIKCGVWVLFEP